jgi:hypothetical protein
MDVRGIAEQESAAFPEVLRHAVVDTIGREPVHFFNLDFEILNDPAADVLELECINKLGAFIAHRADQPRTSLSGQREYREKIGLLEVDMEFIVKCWAGGFDIPDVEKVAVGTAWISRAHRLRTIERTPSHPAMSPRMSLRHWVAADVRRRGCFHRGNR